MELLSNNKRYSIDDKTIICIGFFDGFHIGHQKIINKVLLLAKKEKLKSIFFTFDKKFNNLHDKNKPIFPNDVKKKYIESKKFDYYFEYNFNIANSNKTREKFVDFLIKELKVKIIVVGENFLFGKNKLGNADFIIKNYPNIKTIVIPISKIYDVPISTSYLKNDLAAGKLNSANSLLFNNYHISGTVIEGKKIGRTIGFPTANILVTSKLIIPEGSYISIAVFNGKRYNAITCYRKVNPGNNYLIETHFINQNIYLYNMIITIEFLKFIGDIKIIKSLPELKNHIKNYFDLAIDFFKK